MLLSVGALTFGGKPIFRLLAITIASVATFLLLRDVTSNILAIPPVIEVIGKAFSFNTFYHQYDSPHDIIIPEAHGKELATEFLIAKSFLTTT